ncbi:chorismate--pyruvate lyase family protein [Inmirania thermothiophila]|nr:chorismate lyase [Inmirania thermothiophila]
MGSGSRGFAAGLRRARLAPRPLRRWLCWQGPLLPALGRAAGGARVRLLRAGFLPLAPAEARVLGRRFGYVREVVLEGPRGVLCRARSAADPGLVRRGGGRALARLGTRPLTGWLHRPRGPRLVRRTVAPVAGGWARRSLYRVHGARLLLEERFTREEEGR